MPLAFASTVEFCHASLKGDWPAQPMDPSLGSHVWLANLKRFQHYRACENRERWRFLAEKCLLAPRMLKHDLIVFFSLSEHPIELRGCGNRS